jgi:hypothetical protein
LGEVKDPLVLSVLLNTNPQTMEYKREIKLFSDLKYGFSRALKIVFSGRIENKNE